MEQDLVSLQASWAAANAGLLKIIWGGGVEAGTLATCWAVEGEESTAEIEGAGPTAGSEGEDTAGSEGEDTAGCEGDEGSCGRRGGGLDKASATTLSLPGTCLMLLQNSAM